VVIEYTADLESAANLDMFDIHLFDSFEKSIKEQVKNQFKKKESEELEIPKDSYMASFFMGNIFKIMNIPENQIFTKTLDFKDGYIKRLAKENLDLNFVLEKYKSNYLAVIESKKIFVARAVQFIKWVLSYHLSSEVSLPCSCCLECSRSSET
jgi:hypothetical protein